jgi:hypothetical protein
MTRLKRATILLPLLVVLLGITVPVIVDRSESPRASDADAPEPRVSGRTAGEWAALAAQALEQGRLNRALSYIKTAERVGPGTQYQDELRDVRKARRKASETERVRRRMAGGDLAMVDFAGDGSVTAAHRLVTVLPGESLWTLARDMAAAQQGVLPSEIASDSREVYVLWDALTALNGVRELEVGERVRVPVAPCELAALVDANRRDLGRLAGASAALACGDLDDALLLRRAFEGTFAETTAAGRVLDADLEHALADRAARVALEREHALVDDVRAALARIPELPRVSKHQERLDMLEGARSALDEAESLRDGEQYADASALVARLLSEENRFQVAGDGSLLVGKPSGVGYTDATRQAVEWLLERELERSGSSYPYSDRKTRDEVAWAGYLAAAAVAEESKGADFARMLDAVDQEMEVRLPDPAPYFAD